MFAPAIDLCSSSSICLGSNITAQLDAPLAVAAPPPAAIPAAAVAATATAGAAFAAAAAAATRAPDFTGATAAAAVFADTGTIVFGPCLCLRPCDTSASSTCWR
mmetsp:Transcript_39370/g.103851  ORF Transcript_39370/g.103851 Transcript_39370/m.103851 type:complete len:104 (-) Transcript_39370:1103-1414(-)